MGASQIVAEGFIYLIYKIQEISPATAGFKLTVFIYIYIYEDGDFGTRLKGGLLRFLLRQFFVGDLIDKNSSAIESIDIELSKKSNESFYLLRSLENGDPWEIL